MTTRTEFVNMMADNICGNVIGHIKTMYPDAWKSMQPSARVSMKGCLKNSLRFHLDQLDFVSNDLTHSSGEKTS